MIRDTTTVRGWLCNNCNKGLGMLNTPAVELQGINIYLVMKLLIDADYIVYKACSAAEDEIDWGDDVIMVVSRFSEALKYVNNDLTKIKDASPFMRM